MLRLAKLTDYAIVVLDDMATEPERLHSAKEVADRVVLPYPTVSKLLKQLTQADLVESVRGARGGYRLARSPADISLADVIALKEGPIGLTECSGSYSGCERSSTCNVSANWVRISSAIRAALGDVMLADLRHPGARPTLNEIPRAPTPGPRRSFGAGDNWYAREERESHSG
jgi:FeS assembly SUF system regulator